MSDKIFVDTNLYVYTFYDEKYSKRDKATEILNNLIKEGNCVISFQIVQELLNVLKKKHYDFFSTDALQFFLNKTVYPFCKVFPSQQLYTLAIDISLRWKFSFYDSLVIAAALEANCSYIYSEDLQHQQKIYSLEIVNPFLLD